MPVTRAAWRQVKRLRYIIALVAIGLVISGLNLLWRHTETRPPHWDMARHVWTSVMYLNTAHAGAWAVFKGYFYYPPIIYLNAVIFYKLLGVSVFKAVLANQVFSFIGLVSVYGIGKAVKNQKTGLLAALVFASSPLVATQFKEFQIDGPLASMTALSIWALVSSPDFQNRWVSIGIGASVGLAMLTKWTYFGLILVPLAYCLGLAVWRSRDARDWTRLYNAALAMGVAGIVAVPWYWAHHRQLWTEINANNIAQAALIKGAPVGLGWASLTYYAANALNVTLYLAPVLLLAVGLWRYARQNGWRNHKMNILVALLAGTYAFFTVVTNKDARYTLPFLPAVAVLATYWLADLTVLRRRFLEAGVVFYCIVTYIAVSFGVSWLPSSVILYFGNYPLILWAQHGYIIAQPTKEHWHMQQIFERVKNSSLAYQGSDTVWFNHWAMTYYSAVDNVAQEDLSADPKFDLVRSTSDSVVAGYSPVQSYVLPDATKLTLFKRN